MIFQVFILLLNGEIQQAKRRFQRFFTGFGNNVRRTAAGFA